MRDPTAQMEALCRRLGLAFDPAVLQPYDRLDGKMVDGVYPESAPMGDPGFLAHGRIDPSAAVPRSGRRSRCRSGSRPGKSPRASAMPCPSIDRTTGALTVNLSLVSGTCANPDEVATVGDNEGQEQIAIVGMAGRFPGAADVDTFWTNLRAGVESIRAFTDAELTGGADTPNRAS